MATSSVLNKVVKLFLSIIMGVGCFFLLFFHILYLMIGWTMQSLQTDSQFGMLRSEVWNSDRNNSSISSLRWFSRTSSPRIHRLGSNNNSLSPLARQLPAMLPRNFPLFKLQDLLGNLWLSTQPKLLILINLYFWHSWKVLVLTQQKIISQELNESFH